MNINSVIDKNAVSSVNLISASGINDLDENDENGYLDEYTESFEAQKFKEIVQKYDITNMTQSDANQMYRQLYTNNLISFKELSEATFDTSRLTSEKPEINQDSPIDFLANFKKQAETNKQEGNSDFQSNFDNMVNLAEKILYFQTSAV